MKIRDLLKTEDNWIQRACARSKDNREIDTHSKLAVKWCLLAAVHKCYPNDEDRLEVFYKINIYIKSISALGFNEVGYNDLETTTFEDIQRLYTKLDI